MSKYTVIGWYSRPAGKDKEAEVYKNGDDIIPTEFELKSFPEKFTLVTEDDDDGEGKDKKVEDTRPYKDRLAEAKSNLEAFIAKEGTTDEDKAEAEMLLKGTKSNDWIAEVVAFLESEVVTEDDDDGEGEELTEE